MLQHKVAIIIPSTVNGNEPAPRQLVNRWIQAAKLKFGRLFGGFTCFDAEGGWVSEQHGLIEEAVTVVSSFTDGDGLRFIDDVKEFAARMAEAMGQEAVSIELDHTLQFITPVMVAG
ncbi:MAG TPA: hypothetical protein VGG64_04565 [Pirellulales bacterium]|jgi:hypothetical protein